MNIGSNNTFSNVKVVLIIQYKVVGPFKELYTSPSGRHLHYNTNVASVGGGAFSQLFTLSPYLYYISP